MLARRGGGEGERPRVFVKASKLKCKVKLLRRALGSVGDAVCLLEFPVRCTYVLVSACLNAETLHIDAE
jgi:hypothetical protein